MKLLIFMVFVMVSAPVLPQLSVAEIFTDNMLLQREEPISVWGMAAADAEVEVSFMGRVYKTRADEKGYWETRLEPQSAQASPQTLKITASGEEILLENILIGDVWLLIGQSNMEWPMSGELFFQEEVKHADNEELRYYNAQFIGKNIYGQAYTPQQREKLENKEFYEGTWEVSDSASVRGMSAVGYYFGKEINQKAGVPVGLINLAIGGAPLETFISIETLHDSKQFASKAAGNWLFNEDLPDWVRVRGRENVGEEKASNDPLGPAHGFRPGYAFETGVAPILQMPIKGILWYQGESNAQEPERVKEYADLQKLMIEDYRKKWNKPELPFYWVQLSSIDTLNYDSHYWPEFRDEQRRLLDEVEHVGMAVSSDVGNPNDVHPRNKKAVGKRLARWALNQDYGKDIVVSGPLPRKAEFKGGKVYISFDHAEGLHASEGNDIKGFSLDGTTQLPARAEGGKIILESPEKPEYVYYGWSPYSEANLVNSEELPASTFKLKVD